MVNRRDTLKLAAGAALGLQAAPAVAAEGQETTTDDEETTTVGDDLSGVFLAGLTGDQHVPSVETEAQGAATFAVNQDGGVDYALAVQDIENVTQAHIHLGEVGQSGEVVVWLYPGPDADEPELLEDEFDGMLAADTFEDGNLTGPLEGESIEAALEAMADGTTYVNVHTEENPGGEIRGQILTVNETVDSMDLEQATTPAEETTTAEDEETMPEDETTVPDDESEATTLPDEEETTTA